MFFSIIIPVYNAERTLNRCLRSIMDQTFSDYEVIMIDDGSTDNSYPVCQSYTEKDPRFTLIHQENRGPSAARNHGLRRAAGQYICFVDSDDYVSNNYLSLLFAEADMTKTDMLFFGYYISNFRGDILGTVTPPSGLSGKELLVSLSDCDMFGYPWIKCISRKIAEGVFFPEDMLLFEDEVYTCLVAERAEHVSMLREPLYYYVTDGADMLTGRTHVNYCELSEKVYEAWEYLMRRELTRKTVMQRKANAFTSRCRYYGFEHDLNRQEFFQSLAETRFFQEQTNWDYLNRQIKKGHWMSLETAAKLYRLKNRLRTGIERISSKQS